MRLPPPATLQPGFEPALKFPREPEAAAAKPGLLATQDSQTWAKKRLFELTSSQTRASCRAESTCERHRGTP